MDHPDPPADRVKVRRLRRLGAFPARATAAGAPLSGGVTVEDVGKNDDGPSKPRSPGTGRGYRPYGAQEGKPMSGGG